jgi:hypothetical protein
MLPSFVTPNEQVLREKPGGQPLFPAELYVSSKISVTSTTLCLDQRLQRIP